MQSRVALLLVLLLVGCDSAVEYVSIPAKVIDNPENVRIELVYSNDSDRAVCLSPDSWPNAAGKLNQASDVVALLVGNERFPIEDFNTGYCFGEECVVRVVPGVTIRGFIPYKEFRLPERLRYAPKRLEFPIRAYVCESSDDAPYKPKWRSKQEN